MRKLRKKIRNKVQRCVFAATVLFYVLFPQPGFCACPDCHCSNKIPSPQTVETENAAASDGCCCCQQKAASKSVDSCCSTKPGREKTSDDCDCSCSETRLPPVPVQRTIVQTFQELVESVKDLQTTPFALPLIPEALGEPIFAVKTFETAMSRLPVRLHLLLLVLLN